MPAYRRNHEHPVPEHFYNGVAAPPFASEGVAARTTREGASGFDTKAPRTSAFAGVIATVGPRPELNPSRERSNLPDGFLELTAARSRARSPRHPPQGPSSRSQPPQREPPPSRLAPFYPRSRSTACCRLLVDTTTISHATRESANTLRTLRMCVPQVCACVHVGYFSRPGSWPIIYSYVIYKRQSAVCAAADAIERRRAER